MPALSLRTGLLHAAGNVNVAAVGQIILNRILNANEKPIMVSDTAEALGLSQEAVRDALLQLSELGLLSVGGGDISGATEITPRGFTLFVEAGAETTLFTSQGMSNDGKPLVLSRPIYDATSGAVFSATVSESGGQFHLVLNRTYHGQPTSSALESTFNTEPELHDALIGYFDHDGFPETYVYKGKALTPHLSSREHDGETLTLLDLREDGKAPEVTFTGESEDDCRRQLVKWHEAASLGHFQSLTDKAEVKKSRSRK